MARKKRFTIKDDMVGTYSIWYFDETGEKCKWFGSENGLKSDCPEAIIEYKGKLKKK